MAIPAIKRIGMSQYKSNNQSNGGLFTSTAGFMSNIFCLVVSMATSATSTFMESVKNGLLLMKIRCGGMVYFPLSNCVKPYFLMRRYFAPSKVVSVLYDSIISKGAKVCSSGKTTTSVESAATLIV